MFTGLQAKEGEITSQINLWNAGTEKNGYPDARILTSALLNGGVDENGAVMKENDGFIYPNVDQIINGSIVKM